MGKYKQDSKLLDIIESLKNKRISGADLTTRLKRKIVQFFMTEHSELTNRFVASLLACSESLVCKIKHQLVRDMSWEMDRMDIKEIATAHKIKKTELQQRAMRAGDYALAWKIEMDYLDSLRRLGFIFEAPKRLLISDDPLALRSELERFFDEFDVRNPAEFARLLHAAAATNGGARRLIGLPAAIPAVVVGSADGGADGETSGLKDPIPPGDKD